MTGRSTVCGVLVCLLAGVGMGWMIGGGPGEDQVSGPGTKSEERVRRMSRLQRPSGVTGMVGRVDGQKGTSRKMRSAYSLAMSVPVNQIEEWLEGDYFDTPDGRVDTFFYRILYDRFLDADPEAFMTYCVYKEEEADVTARYMKEWAERDPIASVEFLRGMTDRRRIGPVAGIVLEQLAENDLEAAMELMGELSQQSGVESWNLRAGIQKLADADPDRLVLESKGWIPELRQQVFQQAAQGVFKQGFLEGLDWIQDLPGDQGRRMFTQLSSGQEGFGAKMLAHAADLPEGWLNEAVGSNYWSLVRGDPEKWLEADGEALGLKAETAKSVRTSALSQLVREDWEKASLWLDSAELSESERKSLLGNMISNLASRSMEEAKAWAGGLSDSVLREAALADIENRWGAYHSSMEGGRPEETIALAASGNGISGLHMMRYWNAKDASEAIGAFENLAEKEQSEAAKQLVHQMHYLPSELSGAAVRVLLEAKGESEEEGNRSQINSSTVQRLVGSWGDEDPAAAARWVETLPVGKERDDAVRMLLSTWTMQDPEEAERWKKR